MSNRFSKYNDNLESINKSMDEMDNTLTDIEEVLKANELISYVDMDLIMNSSEAGKSISSELTE